jgi:hypothetical protein
MAALVGINGAVTAASGTWSSILALFSPMSAQLQFVGGEFDTTEFMATAAARIPRSFLPALRTATVTIEAYSATPITGIVGSVSGTDYATNMFEWEMTISQAALDVTDFSAYSATAGLTAWRSFAPGLQDWQGSYAGFVDDTTIITNITASSAAPSLAAATFTVSSGNTLGGNILTRGGSVGISIGDRSVVRYEYRGSSDVAVVGSANVLPANATMVAMPAGSMTISAKNTSTVRTYIGSFIPTSFNIRVGVGELTRIRATGQLTGALAIA